MSILCKVHAGILLLVFVANDAYANLVTFEVTGEVTHFLAGPSVSWTVPIGTAFRGVFTFDGAAQDQSPTWEALGQYRDCIVSSTFWIGDDATIDTGIASRISVGDNLDGYDGYTVHDSSISFRNIDSRISLVFFDSDQNVFSSDTLPLTAPPLAEFEEADWSMGTENSDFGIVGNFSSFTLHMPEPSSVLLLAGVAVVLRRRC